MPSSGSGNRFGRRPQSTHITSATVIFTSTTVPEMGPAPSPLAASAAQLAVQRPAGFSSRPIASRTATEADRQRALPPPPSGPPQSGAAVVNNTPGSAMDNCDVECGDPNCRLSHHPRGNDIPDPPPQYSDRGGKGAKSNDPLAYGQDSRGQSSKDKASSHTNKLKKFGASLFAEPRRDSRAEQGFETDKERYKRERDEWKHHCRDLEDANNYNITIIKQLQDDLTKEQDRVDRTKRSANLLETKLDNKEIFLGVQARNDEEIRGKFGSIISSIKTWSNNFNAGVGHAFREEMLPEYQRVTPLCTRLQYLERLVEDKKRKRLFVRGWAAYVMTNSLFRTLDPLGDLGTDVWMEEGLADTFKRLENELWYADRKLITYRAFNDWRAFTADLLSRSFSGHTQKSEDEIRKAVQDAVRDVMELVQPWCVTGDHDALRGYADRLHRIFTEAVQLAQFLRRQRALWSIRFPSRPSLPDLPETGPLMFDPTSMKDDRGDDEDMHPENLKQQYVDIVVTPALYKRGNTNGEKFENEEAAAPAVVIMRAA